MCEANAYVYKNGKEELILETVDLVEPQLYRYHGPGALPSFF